MIVSQAVDGPKFKPCDIFRCVVYTKNNELHSIPANHRIPRCSTYVVRTSEYEGMEENDDVIRPEERKEGISGFPPTLHPHGFPTPGPTCHGQGSPGGFAHLSGKVNE